MEYKRKINLNSILIYVKQKRIKKFTNSCCKKLQKIFPDVNSTIEKTYETFKERSKDIDNLIKKLGETDENADQVTFQFEFFNGGKIQKFDSFTKNMD